MRAQMSWQNQSLCVRRLVLFEFSAIYYDYEEVKNLEYSIASGNPGQSIAVAELD